MQLTNERSETRFCFTTNNSITNIQCNNNTMTALLPTLSLMPIVMTNSYGRRTTTGMMYRINEWNLRCNCSKGKLNPATKENNLSLPCLCPSTEWTFQASPSSAGPTLIAVDLSSPQSSSCHPFTQQSSPPFKILTVSLQMPSPYDLYCVGGTLSLTQSINQAFKWISWNTEKCERDCNNCCAAQNLAIHAGFD